MTRPGSDVVVVGAGVIGSSIAYHLARRGATVTLVDASPEPQPPAATWASAGGVRRQHRDPREWPLTQEAARRWPELADELGFPTGFHASGHLHVAQTDAGLAAVAERAARERAYGLDVQLLAAPELAAIAPNLAPHLLGGEYSPGDGQADPRATALAFAQAAVRLGGRFLSDRVKTVTVASDRARGVTLAASTLASERVVLAAGAWTLSLCNQAGVRLAVEAIALQILLTDPTSPILQPTVTAEELKLSIKQLTGGQLLLGGGWPATVEDGLRGCQLLDTSRVGNWAAACQILPQLAGRKVARSWCGIESRSADGVAMLGAAGPEGLFVAVGFSGHGFQLSPAIGRAVADLVLGDNVPELAGLVPR